MSGNFRNTQDIDYRTSRGLDRRLFDMLLKGDWIANHENCAIIGPTDPTT